ncbi:MAG: hypothetical protein K0S07_1360 [Chlamydiales bacterium]|jgi:hypothetical protein|nr:hypothetical protein [Chlamydiales bacterium]
MTGIVVPIELVTYILSFLPNNQLLESRLVNRTFARAVNSPLLGHRFTLYCSRLGAAVDAPFLQIKRLDNNGARREDMIALSRSLQHLQIEELESHQWQQYQTLSKEDLEEILPNFPHLKIADIYFNFDPLNLLSLHCPLLEHLELKGPFDWQGIEERSFSHLLSLNHYAIGRDERLNQKGGSLSWMLEKCPRLKELSLFDYRPIDLQASALDLIPMPSFKKITMYCCSLNTAILKHLVSNSQELEELILSNTCVLTDFWTALKPNPFLKKLTYNPGHQMHSCESERLWDDCLLSLIAKFPNLEELNIGNNQLTDAVWDRVPNGALLKLRRLVLDQQRSGVSNQSVIERFQTRYENRGKTIEISATYSLEG